VPLSPSDSPCVLEAHELSYSYRRRSALTEVSFKLNRGVVFLVGANGAGKTTLLKLLAGELRPPASARVAPKVGIAYLPQSPQLCKTMRCLEFVAYCGWLQGLSSREALSAAPDALRQVGLSERANTSTRELSGGMQRRLAIAGVLVSRREILLLDEPMSGLDPQQRSEVRKLLADLGENNLVVVSSHVMQDIAQVSNEILMLNKGRLIFHGSLSEFLEDPSLSTPTLERLENKFIERLGTSGC